METKVSTSQKIEVAITNSTKKQPIKRTSKKVKDNLEFYKEKFGIRCKVLITESVLNQGRLGEPRVVDEKKCLFYLISIQ
jgi:hypothetical protein